MQYRSTVDNGDCNSFASIYNKRMGRNKNIKRKEEINELLEKGFKTQEIARLLGIDRQLADYYKKLSTEETLQNKKDKVT